MGTELQVRVGNGRALAPAGAATPPAGAKQPKEKPNQRGKVALLAVEAGVAVNLTGRLLSVTRLAYAAPLAAKNHKLPLWGLEMLFQKSTIDVVPYTGGPHDLWGKAYAASAGLKLLGAMLTLGIAIPNLRDAVNNHGGRDGLLGSRSGRTGLTTAVAGVMTLGFLGKAAANGSSAGASGIAHSMFHDPILGKWPFVGAQIAAYSVVIANELGFFDFADAGSHLTPGQVAGTTWRNIKAKVSSAYEKRVGSHNGRRDAALAVMGIPLTFALAGGAVRSTSSGWGIAADAFHSPTLRKPVFLAVEAIAGAALIGNAFGLFSKLDTKAPTAPAVALPPVI